MGLQSVTPQAAVLKFHLFDSVYNNWFKQANNSNAPVWAHWARKFGPQSHDNYQQITDPIARSFGVPVISYKEAAYPKHYAAFQNALLNSGSWTARIEPLKTMSRGDRHPPWWVHQLMANTLSYNWDQEKRKA